ncbi:Follicle-stimulating hormone receptor [Bagarius yarrelli]|uniref:Follicle-stimulating hormone receptor n=1 Tax=Bagarius yarrelli TaxID=175774 RepID=A0A556TJE8_BAGYA|nr:Follicle-stimulating hormone receptor [Bagarius yarrelli]
MVWASMLRFMLYWLMMHAGDVFLGSDACLANGTTRSFLCVGNKVQLMPYQIPKNTTYVEIRLTQIIIFPRKAMSSLHDLKRIMVSENGVLQRIEAYAFANLTKLEEMTISNTGLKVLPDFSKVQSTAFEFLFDLEDNMHIELIPSNAFAGLTSGTITELRLTKNGITDVDTNAFNGSRIEKLFLMGNQQLKRIHNYAFLGAEGPLVLDISHTAISSLPENMLRRLKLLIAKSVYTLRWLPNLEVFAELTQANFTYPSHCCAFKNFKKNKSTKNHLCNDSTIRNQEPYFFEEHCKEVIESLFFHSPHCLQFPFQPKQLSRGHLCSEVLHPSLTHKPMHTAPTNVR